MPIPGSRNRRPSIRRPLVRRVLLARAPSVSGSASRSATNGAPLDALLWILGDDDSLDEDAGVCTFAGRSLRFDEFFNLGDRDATGLSAERIEVLGGLFVDEVAVTVSDARVHQGEVTGDRSLQYEFDAVEEPDLLGCEARRRTFGP